MIDNEIKYEVFKYYSNCEIPKCKHCGIEDIRTLCLDHVNNDGKLHRKEDSQARGINLYKKLFLNNFKCNYELQVLCFNCNNIKIIVENENNHLKPDHWKITMSKIGKLKLMKTGKDSIRAKKVYQYNLSGIFIKEWDYIKQAELYYNINTNSKNITNCCTGKQNTAYGFIWKHFKIEKTQSFLNKKIKRKGKLILNLETGIFYDSIIEASNSMCITINILKNNLKGNNKTNLIYA